MMELAQELLQKAGTGVRDSAQVPVPEHFLALPLCRIHAARLGRAPINPQVRPFELSEPDLLAHLRELLHLRPSEDIFPRLRLGDLEELGGALEGFLS